MKTLKTLFTIGMIGFQSLAGAMTTETQQALGTLSSTSNVGNIGVSAPAPIISDADMQNHEISTEREIIEILESLNENRFTYPLQEMINRATRIVDNAKQMDYAPAFILGKALAVVDQTIRNSGYNEDFLGNFFQSYMEVSYNLSLKFLRTPGCSSLQGERMYVTVDFERCFAAVPNHVVAVSVAQDLWKYSASLISSTAEAVMVIHAISALKTGLNDNPRRNEVGFKDLFVRIDQIERQNVSYSNMVRSISNFQEPLEQDVNNVRYELLKIFERVPQITTASR